MQKNKEDKSINLLDILKYLSFHWKWFALSVLVFGSFYQYQYSKTAFIYKQAETVMIKTPVNTPTTSTITRSNNAFNSVSVAGEVLQLRSKELMRQTIRRIDADISYTVRKRLRNYELYKKSPIQIASLENSKDEYFSFTISPIDSEHVLLKNWNKEGEKDVKVALNTQVNTPIGKMMLTVSEHYTKDADDKDIKVTKYPLNNRVAHFMSNLNITQTEADASILQVSLEDNSPERAADLITMLITVYNEISLEDKNKIGIYTADFIQERLAIIESELGTVESSIERLKTSNQGIDVEVAGGMYLSDSRELQAERAKIETDQKLAEMMREYLTSENKQTELIPNNTGLVDASVERLITDYNAILLKRNRLIEGGSVENPMVKELGSSLEAMRRNIERAVDNTLAGLEIRRKNVQKSELQARSKVMQVPKKQRVMLSVERQQKVKESLYLYLLNKREENAINQAMTDDNIRIIDPAFGSSAPMYPIRTKKLLMGVGVGLALPAIILLLIMMFDTGVKGRKDVEEALTIPFLGEVPYVAREKEASELVVDEKSRNYISEMFRILRTNIGFMAAGKDRRVITFTSFNIGAGKTFTAVNLAASFKYLDKKVVLLDLDLRKGTLSERTKAPKGMGVTNYLADSTIALDDVIYKNMVEDSIDLIPIGINAPNPVELLLSERLDELIALLKERYDYVIIDNVPVNVVADASIVNRISELTIFVIRSGKMDRRQLPEIQELYDQKKISNLAVLLNGVKLKRSGYGYGYGYQYGYGYGMEDERKKSLYDRIFKRNS